MSKQGPKGAKAVPRAKVTGLTPGDVPFTGGGPDLPCLDQDAPLITAESAPELHRLLTDAIDYDRILKPLKK